MIKDLIITGSGEFQVTVQLMNGTMPLPHNYSLSSEEAVVVEVSLNTSSQQIKVVINKCWATPTLHPVDISSYIFLENRSAPPTALPYSVSISISDSYSLPFIESNMLTAIIGITTTSGTLGVRSHKGLDYEHKGS